MSDPLTISYLSPEGIEIFEQATDRAGFWALSAAFLTQETQTFCGVASTVCVFNALPVKKPVTKPYAPYAYFTQDNYFSEAVEKVVPRKQVLEEGMVLQQLAEAIRAWDVPAAPVHAGASDVDAFRSQARAACGSTSQAVIVNFLRGALLEEGEGHFSPLGAYDPKTDHFLVMDVARYKYPPVWVKTVDLFNAMNSLDSGSDETRGWCVVG